MFLYIFYGFAACLASAELLYLGVQLVQGQNSFLIVLKFSEYCCISLWVCAVTSEGKPIARKWLSATWGWCVGTVLVILFIRWSQPDEILAEFRSLGLMACGALAMRWWLLRKKSLLKPNGLCATASSQAADPPTDPT